MLNFWFSLFFLFTNLPAARGGILILKNGNLVDLEAKRIISGDLVIEEGKVKTLLLQGQAMAAAGSAEVLDASGKYVIPGLFDMHTHAWGNPSPGGSPMILGMRGAADLMLYAGVTGFLDLLSLEAEVFSLRDKQRAGGLSTSEIFAAGPCLTAPRGHCSEFLIPTRIIDSPEGAAAEIREVAKLRPDVVKIVYDHAIDNVPTISLETLKAALDTAKGLGLPSVVHIGTWDDAVDAIKAGASAITHLHHEELPDRVAELMAAKDIFMIPTLTVQRSFLDIVENQDLLTDPFLKDLTEARFLDEYNSKDISEPRLRFVLDWQNKNRLTNELSFRKLLARKVKILAGTDIGNIGTFVAYSLHKELEFFVQHGMSTWEALRAATLDSAGFLKLPYGLKEGSIGNFVLLNSSPIDDIKATRDIHAVVHRGRVVDRSKLGLNRED